MFRRPSQKNVCKLSQQQQQQQNNAQLNSAVVRPSSSFLTAHPQTPPTSSPKPKRSSSILGKFMKRSSSSSSTTTATATATATNLEIPRLLPDEPSSPALSTNSQFSAYSSYSDQSSLESPPVLGNEKLPADWELRYDTILCQFYYINTKENIVQFDSPLEVLTH